MADQVLTRRGPKPGKETKRRQRLSEKKQPAAKCSPPYIVIQAKPARAETRKAKIGGWKATRYLDHAEFTQARDAAFALQSFGYCWTVAWTIKPADRAMSDAEKQKQIVLLRARLGQSLKRRGQLDVGLRVFEKLKGGDLHGHGLQHVLPENFDVVEGWADRFDRKPVNYKNSDQVEIHARVVGGTFDDVCNAILYLLKQHRRAETEVEVTRRFWRPAGDPIKGRRESFTKAAQAILDDEAQKRSAAVSVAPAAIPPVAAPDHPQEPIQLALGFADAPHIDVRAEIERKRIERGLTERHVAENVLGMKQPNYSNAIVRRHDPLGRWARNRGIEWLRAA